jgi:hypothetical protein
MRFLKSEVDTKSGTKNAKLDQQRIKLILKASTVLLQRRLAGDLDTGSSRGFMIFNREARTTCSFETHVELLHILHRKLSRIVTMPRPMLIGELGIDPKPEFASAIRRPLLVRPKLRTEDSKAMMLTSVTAGEIDFESTSVVFVVDSEVKALLVSD